MQKWWDGGRNDKGRANETRNCAERGAAVQHKGLRRHFPLGPDGRNRITERRNLPSFCKQRGIGSRGFRLCVGEGCQRTVGWLGRGSEQLGPNQENDRQLRGEANRACRGGLSVAKYGD